MKTDFIRSLCWKADVVESAWTEKINTKSHTVRNENE